jgi:DNA-binding response OmpR family regulator
MGQTYPADRSKRQLNVLIVEDDLHLSQLLSRVIVEEGGSADACALGEEGLRRAVAGSYDVMILDWMLPDRDGLSVCQELRRTGALTSILMLTARGEVQDRVRGLKAGADDYLAKPFEIDELLARLGALARRSRAGVVVTFGDLTIDRIARRAAACGSPVDLTAKEFDLLEQLALHPDQPVARASLLCAVWNLRFDPGSGVLDVHVSRLRDKLGRTAWMIETVRGLGYRLRTAR